MFECAMGALPPLRVLEQELMIRDEDSLVLGNEFSSAFQDFLAKCLEQNPRKRWSAQRLLKHPWLQRPIRRKAVKFARKPSPQSRIKPIITILSKHLNKDLT